MLAGCFFYGAAPVSIKADKSFQIGPTDSSQNLVMNPGFEEKYFCPYYGSTSVKNAFACKQWLIIGTIDYFNTCSKDSLVSVPNNTLGYCPPHNGNGYIGGIFIDYAGGEEAVEGRLISPLIAGGEYIVSFWIRTTNKSPGSFHDDFIKNLRYNEGWKIEKK